MKKNTILLLFLVATSSLFAQNPKLALYKLPYDGMSELKTRLFSDMESVEPKGVFKVGVHFDLQRGWYTYTKEETDKNLPTVITLEIPKGFKIIKEEWPTPDKTPGRKGGMDKVYKNDFYVVYHIKAPKKKGDYKLKAALEWQVCDPFICKIGSAALETQITIGKNRKSGVYPLINN